MPRVTGVLRDRPSQDRRLAQSRAALRRSYDAVAADYAARLGGELAHKPFDRARLRDLAPLAAPR